MDNTPEVRFALSDTGSTPDQIQALTQDLSTDLRREIGIRSTLAEDTAEPGSGFRGDAMAIGTLAVQVISSSAAAALINLLSAYFSRKPHLSVEIKRSSGETLTVTADNTSPKSFEATLEKLRHFLPE